MKRTLLTKGILAFALVLFTTTLYAQDKFGGLALYTVRENMGEDPKTTLQKVAEAGYAYIEAAGYENGKFYGMEPNEFKSYLKSVGLTPVSTHMGGVTLENADQQIADTKAAGFEYFTIPVPPMGMFTLIVRVGPWV